MRWRFVFGTVLAAGALALATPSFAVATPGAPSDLDAEMVRDAFRDAGYVTTDPGQWSASARTFSVSDPLSGAIVVRVFVYADSPVAVGEHERASRSEEARRGRSIADSDDRGPELLTGFGLSVWRRNVAMVQASPPTDVGAFPVAPDCSDPVVMTDADAPERAAPDGVLPTTTVDPIFVELLEGLL